MAEEHKKYETVYLLRADLTDETTKKIQDKILEVISRYSGNLENVQDLGKKQLAYRILKHTKAHYFSLNYLGNGQVIEELERHLRLSEDVIRFLTVKKVKNRDIPPENPVPYVPHHRSQEAFE
jgi:small subunit ribosomal protein S6